MRMSTNGLLLAMTVALSSPPAGAAETRALPQPKAVTSKLPSDADKILYTMGVALARTFQNLALSDAELARLKEGLSDAALGRPLKVSPENWGARVPEFAKERLGKIAAGEKGRGEAFLARAASEPGSVRQPSGLLYRELKPGSGVAPAPAGKVLVRYTGTLTDGTVFDASAREGRPVVFDLEQVIPCWKEGLQLMRTGGRARLVCPSDLAYGDTGLPPKIRPGATIVFDLELVDLVK